MIFTWILFWTLFRDIMTVEDIKEGDGYNFHYKVDSQSDNVHFSHNEDRRGYRTIGSYKVLLPDGRTQVVEYKVSDKDSGYVAKVSYQGVATEDKPQYGQPRFKGIKREIPAGSYGNTVKIKPYGRYTEHHKLKLSDIYTTITPIAIENVTVIPSPELVTVASLFDSNTDSSSEEMQQESDSTTAITRTIKSNHGIQSPIIGTPSIKDDDVRLTKSSKTEQHILFTKAVPETTLAVKVIPCPETVTIAMELTGYEYTSDKHDSSIVQESEEMHSIDKIEIIPQNLNKQTKIKNQTLESERYHFQKQLKNDNNVTKGSELYLILKIPDSVNISKYKPNKTKSSYHGINLNKAPILEYNFRPIQDKTTLTKADATLDTKNKALYQTNFTPKSHHLYALNKPVNNYYRKPKYAFTHKKHDKLFLPFHIPLVSHTRRQDGFLPERKENKIKIKKSLENSILGFKNWFPFKL